MDTKQNKHNMTVIVSNGTINVIVPSDCAYYPNNGIQRVVPYQKMTIQNGNDIYVACEAKIYKYDHLLHFASFVVRDKTTFLESSESIAISYELDTEIRPLQRPMLDSERLSLIPTGFDINIVDLIDDVEGTNGTNGTKDTKDPKKMFDCTFSCPANKRSLIVLHARPDGSGGHLLDEQVVMTVDQHNPFGPCDSARHRNVIPLYTRSQL